MKSKTKRRGILILSGIFAVMAVLSAAQITLAGESGISKQLLVRTNIINIFLGTGGMAFLLFLGAGVSKKLKTLEEIVRPIEKRDFPALASIKKDASPSKDGKETYGELKKVMGDIGKFLEVFRAHASVNDHLEKLLETENPSGTGEAPELQVLSARLDEIESSAEQAVSALNEADNYLSSLDETSREQGLAVKEADTRLAATAEFAQSAAALLAGSGKKAAELKDRISAGEEESRNTFDIIKNTAKDLEQITEMAQLINKISDQTNMLSMNAAIESAHAGEAGKGFAVVAEEIRKLADSTRENSDSIQAVLLSITRQINAALKASEISAETFGKITADIAEFSGTLETAAENARKNSESGLEAKAALEESLANAGKIRDSSADIAVFRQSFQEALENIQNLSGAAKNECKKSASGIGQPRLGLEKTLEKVRDYLKETEELEGMIFPREAAAAIQASPADSGFSSAVHSSAAESRSTAEDGKKNSSQAAEQNAPRANSETDNSWRRDVTIKTPPKTVR